MARLKIELPEKFPFTTEIPVRITDLNYGNHVGNDAILSIIHEARMQFLKHFGYTEMEFGGAGMIMSEVEIAFKNELYYGEVVTVSVAAAQLTRIGFDLLYRLEKINAGQKVLVAAARTGMVCYDYKLKKIVNLPGEAVAKWSKPA